MFQTKIIINNNSVVMNILIIHIYQLKANDNLKL